MFLGVSYKKSHSVIGSCLWLEFWGLLPIKSESGKWYAPTPLLAKYSTNERGSIINCNSCIMYLNNPTLWSENCSIRILQPRIPWKCGLQPSGGAGRGGSEIKKYFYDPRQPMMALHAYSPVSSHHPIILFCCNLITPINCVSPFLCIYLLLINRSFTFVPTYTPFK